MMPAAGSSNLLAFETEALTLTLTKSRRLFMLLFCAGLDSISLLGARVYALDVSSHQKHPSHLNAT